MLRFIALALVGLFALGLTACNEEKAAPAATEPDAAAESHDGHDHSHDGHDHSDPNHKH